MKIVFFAQLRERLSTSELSLDDIPSPPKSVAELRNLLCKRGELWQALLTSKQCLCAVNQVIVDDNHLLHAADEIAFFPPVTGG